MQTFLPVPDFEAGARLLDGPRLGKQRVETLQILRALELPDYGWRSHPAVVMWRGRMPALVAYGLAMVRIWRELGHGDTTGPLIAEFAPEVVGRSQEDLARDGLLPSWLGDEALHRSHRSNLLAKDPGFYRPRFTELFGPEPEHLPYVWPDPDDVPASEPPSGTPVWVVRPRDGAGLGECLAAGVMGLGLESGVDVDATGLAPSELSVLARERAGRRPAKALRQLSALVDGVQPGDLVGLLVEQDASLLVGEVTGDYSFAAAGPMPHRRPVSWQRVVPRSAAVRPAALQDPRALFCVMLRPEAVVAQGRSSAGATTS